MAAVCIVFALAAVGLGVWFAILASQKMAKAKQDYEDALEQLKYDPGNPDLHQEVLALGRRYATLP